ncbi:MAG TPA: S-methyl-5-thioribose-1-phosphate isomerase, partial [Kouleothrix sp.]|nr:S-methyl-5-thioribose-1-phosphate isomerase [Kouleothrix sp.]
MKTAETFQHIWWDGDAVGLLDQRLLPGAEVAVRCATLGDVVQAIKSMQVRGAPAIGCTAAYGMALVAQQHHGSAAELLARLAEAKAALDASR